MAVRNRGSRREQRQRRSAAESVGERDGEKERNETVGDPKKTLQKGGGQTKTEVVCAKGRRCGGSVKQLHCRRNPTVGILRQHAE